MKALVIAILVSLVLVAGAQAASSMRTVSVWDPTFVRVNSDIRCLVSKGSIICSLKDARRGDYTAYLDADAAVISGRGRSVICLHGEICQTP